MTLPADQQLASALLQPGFDQWIPTVDVPELHRPSQRPNDLPGTGRIAAVLILIYPDDAKSTSLLDSHLVLTKRHANLSKHANQISFPGGRQDEGETLVETAIRETREEIGATVTGSQILGNLNNVYIPPSDFTVTPFVGWVPERPSFVLSEAEVEEVIETSIGHLMKPETLGFDYVETSRRNIQVPVYRVGSHQVWGATAIMISELLERLRCVVKNSYG